MSDKVVKALTDVLANSYTLMLKTQNYHWNVKGKDFYELHLLFETHYNDLFTAIDEVAERIRTLGGYTIGSFKEYTALSKIQEEKNHETNGVKILKNLSKDHATIVSVIKNSLAIAQKAGDEPTADIFIGRLKFHEKAKWMLDSSL